jgi:hypothetical protein
MAKVQVGGIRTTSSRGASSPEGESNPTPSKRFKWEFQSAADHLLLSLEERIVHYSSNGTREELPRTAKKSRLDNVQFADNYFGTDDDALAEAIMASAFYGLPAVGGKCWLRDDLLKVQRVAEADELRRRLEQNPDLKRLVLTPSESDDVQLPPPVA